VAKLAGEERDRVARHVNRGDGQRQRRGHWGTLRANESRGRIAADQKRGDYDVREDSSHSRNPVREMARLLGAVWLANPVPAP
jgi:hypothetical protein